MIKRKIILSLLLGATMHAMDQNKQTPFMLQGMTEKGLKNPIKVEYTNYRGEKGVRTIVPLSFFFGTTEYHPKEQWLIKLWDVDRQAERIYALQEITRWFVE
jgi:hypothetical protein